ncbi:MAG: hypothetical protein R3F17_02115 [Planctomycetota bacterium]
MRALNLKNSLLLLAFGFGGTFLTTALAFDRGFDQAFVYPGPNFFHGTWFALPILAVVFGMVAALWDRVRGTQEYFQHRPLGQPGLEARQWILYALCLAAWIVVPFGALAAFGSGTYPAEYAAVGGMRLSALAMIFPLFGAGYLAASLPCGPISRLLLGSTLVYWVAGETMEALLDVPRPWGGVSRMLVFLVFTGLCAWASIGSHQSGEDPDRPIGKAAIPAALLALFAVAWGLPSALDRANMGFARKGPHYTVLKEADGGARLGVHEQIGGGGWVYRFPEGTPSPLPSPARIISWPDHPISLVYRAAGRRLDGLALTAVGNRPATHGVPYQRHSGQFLDDRGISTKYRSYLGHPVGKVSHYAESRRLRIEACRPGGFAIPVMADRAANSPQHYVLDLPR